MDRQLRRFCRYGFLKNQRYFEAFFLLALLDRGLGFAKIGLLFGGRELLLNLCEVPSGALADRWGKRRCLILAQVCYIVAYALLGLAEGFGLLSLAMLGLALGDSFRSGTHKAMIFTWLRLRGRLEEKTAIYGRTRSWSKAGSAVSVLVGGLLLYFSGDYRWLFWQALLPCLLGMVNIASYPAELDPRSTNQPRPILGSIRSSLADVLRNPPLRRLILESMTFEGLFKASKDYLQPFLQVTVLGLAAGSSDPRTALLLTPAYFLLFVLSALASRSADRFQGQGSPSQATRRLWLFLLLTFASMGLGAWTGVWILAALAFFALHLLQNLFRPILIGRLQEWTAEDRAATLLSIESQTRGLGAVLLLPILGWAVDRGQGPGGFAVLPVAACGVGITLLAIAGLRGPEATHPEGTGWE